MPESNLQQVILNGLDTAYDAIITSLTTTIDDTSMEDFQAQLLAFESRLQGQMTSDPLSPSANAALKSSPRPFSSNNQGRGAANHIGQRSGPQSASGPCQLCGHRNHAAASYWYRFDHQFNADSSNATLILLHPPHFFYQNWYPDSGSTHHVTSYLGNLSIHSEYTGPDQLCIGNGVGLPISHIGMSSLSTSKDQFILKDIFHIPQISKNLLSVSKFTLDNDFFFEFHPNFFAVKDCCTGRIVF